MNSFYTIVKIVSNIAANDSISIGLIANTKDGFMAGFSMRKMQIAKILLEENESLVDFVVQQIKSKLKQMNEEKDSESADYIQNRVLKLEHFQYLHNYSNNTLQFSPPKVVEDSIDSEKFDKLFEVFVDSKPWFNFSEINESWVSLNSPYCNQSSEQFSVFSFRENNPLSHSSKMDSWISKYRPLNEKKQIEPRVHFTSTVLSIKNTLIPTPFDKSLKYKKGKKKPNHLQDQLDMEKLEEGKEKE